MEVGTLKYPARLSVVVVALSDPCKNSLSRLSVSSIEELSMSLRSSSLEAEDPLLDAADETLLDAADETLLLSFRRKIFSRFSNSFLYLESVEGISPSSTSSGEIRNLLNNSVRGKALRTYGRMDTSSQFWLIMLYLTQQSVMLSLTPSMFI